MGELAARADEPDIAEQARVRQEQLGRTRGAAPLGAFAPKGKTRDEVAKAVGLGSGDTFARNEKVLNDALALGIVTDAQLDADRPERGGATRSLTHRLKCGQSIISAHFRHVIWA